MTPQALLAALGRPAVIITGLPLRSVTEVTSGGASGIRVEQVLSTGEPIFVVTIPFTGDSAPVGVVTLPGDSAVGTVRVGNYLVNVSGRVPADTVEALIRRLSVARSN